MPCFDSNSLGQVMERLTLPAVCDLARGQDIREIKALNASRKNIQHVDDIRYVIILLLTFGATQ